MSLKTKVKNGLKWTFIDQVFAQAVSLVFGILLARLLEPSAFGLIGMVLLFSNFALNFVDLGFGAALIQKKDVTQEHFSSVFWLNMMVGTLLYVFFFLLAPFISLLYKQPELIDLIRIICLTFIVTAISSVHVNLLVRELQFKKKIIINCISVIFSYSLGFFLAYKGYGVWSLAIIGLLIASINTVFYCIFSNWIPSFVFNWGKIKELSNFGLNFMGENIVSYWSRNYDNFIIGKMLGSTELGIYSRAYSLMLTPLRNFSTVINKVMFPAFSQKQGDLPLLKKYYLKIIMFVSLFALPLMIMLAVVSKEFILLCFGEKWQRMIPILSILSVLGVIQTILALNALIYNSLGKTNIAFKISIIPNALYIVAFTVGVNYGIIGVAYSFLLINILLFIPLYKNAIKLLDITLLEVFKVLKGIIIASFAMTALLLTLNYYLKISLTIDLILKLILGGLTYLIFIFIFEKELILVLKYKIHTFLSNRNK